MVAASPATCGSFTIAYCFTVTQSATYYDTTEVFYAPAGSGPPFSAGANDGVVLTLDVASGHCNLATPIPDAGKYCVNGGSYSFNSGDASKKIAIYYRYTASTVASGYSYLKIIHDWIDSSASDFIDNGVDYAIPGAQYNRPWVHVASTWAALVDGATGTNYYPLPYMLGGAGNFVPDGLHPQPYGGAVIANAMIVAATAAGAIQASPALALPTANNYQIDSGNSFNSGTVTGGGVCGDTVKADYIGFASPAASTGIYGSGTSVTTPTIILDSTITVNGTPTYTVQIDCVDQTNNLLHIKNPGTGSSTSSALANMLAQADATELIPNNLMSLKASSTDTGTNGINTSSVITGCSTGNANCLTPSTGYTVTKGYPKAWSLSLDGGSQTAIGAGTLGFAYGMEANPFSDGDDFVIQVSGYAGSGGGSLTMTKNANTGVKAAIVAGSGTGNDGDLQRITCEVRISAGPNGHLTGFTGVQVKSTDTLSSATNSPAFHPVMRRGTMGSRLGPPHLAAARLPYRMGFCKPGARSFWRCSDNSRNVSAIQSGNTINGLSASISFSWSSKDPVSFTARLSRCWLGKVTS